MVELQYLLVILLVITEILPFMKYFSKSFKYSDSIILLFYNIINSILKYIGNARTREQRETERIEKAIVRVLQEHANHNHPQQSLQHTNSIVSLPSRHGTTGATELDTTLPPINQLA